MGRVQTPNGWPFKPILLLLHPLTVQAVAGRRSGNMTLEGQKFYRMPRSFTKHRAKKHRSTLERLAREREGAVAAPIAAGNNWKLSQRVRIGSV